MTEMTKERREKLRREIDSTKRVTVDSDQWAEWLDIADELLDALDAAEAELAARTKHHERLANEVIDLRAARDERDELVEKLREAEAELPERVLHGVDGGLPAAVRHMVLELDEARRLAEEWRAEAALAANYRGSTVIFTSDGPVRVAGHEEPRFRGNPNS